MTRLTRIVNHRRNATPATLNRALESFRVAFPNGGPSDPHARVTRLGMLRGKVRA